MIGAACGEVDEGHPVAGNGADAIVWFIVGALFLAVAFAWLEINRPYYFAQDDALVAELPGMLEGCRSVWAGVWPDYDPCRLMGGPLAGTGVFSLTYPPTYLSYAIARHLLRNEYALLEVFAALHLAAGYCVTTWLCRRMGIRPMIACCATLSFLLSGSILIMGRSWHTFLPIVVWMPLLMIAVNRLVKGPVGLGWAMGTGLVAGLLFHVGFPQLWVYAMLLVACSLLALWTTGAISWRRLLSAWPAVVIALGLIVPLLLPEISIARDVLRPPPYGIGITKEWIAAILPYPLVKVVHPMGWGSTEVQYMGHFVYFGSVFAVLVVSSFLAVLSRGSRRIWGRNIWLACAAVSLLLTMGDQGLLFYVLSKLPLIRTVNNNPFRALPFFVLFAVIGSGAVAERALATTNKPLKWPGSIALLTLLLLAYHVTMARPSFYTYGFKPYPPLAPSISKRIDGNTSARIISWTTSRSISSDFAATLPLDLPMLHNAFAYSGYDPLLQWGTSYQQAETLVAQRPVEALRAYGVRWHLLSPLLRAPVLSPNPEVNAQEEFIQDRAAMKAVMPLLHIIAHTDEAKLGELPDVSPIAFPQQRATLSLPVMAGGDGIKVNLRKWKAGGRVVVNFLWYPQMRALIDGKPTEVTPDPWQRIVVKVPANSKLLQIRYTAHWWRGMAIGFALILLGLFGSWMGGRAGIGLQHVNLEPSH